MADDYSTLGNVLRVLMCMDWDSSALNKQMQLERNMDASASTLTFQDRQKVEKGQGLGPKTWRKLKKLLQHIAQWCGLSLESYVTIELSVSPCWNR